MSISPATYWTDASESTRADAAAWYPSANAWAHEQAREYSVEPALVCGLLAVLSPGVSWELNKRDVRGVLRWGLKAYTPATWGANRRKAQALLDGYSFHDVVEFRTSPKVFSFYCNIADPTGDEHVTVDRWIARVHLGRDTITHRQYRDIAEQYREAASTVSIVPCTLQACAWLQARNTNKLQFELPF